MTRPPKRFVPEPFDYHHELELTIGSLTNMGHGVARHDGWVVFVPFTLPGERVRARIYRNHKAHSDADLLEVLEPSPERIAPRCPLFTQCGGCQYQHLNYPGQLSWKHGQVVELLARLAGIEGFPVEPVVPSPETYAYRSKITPHFQRPKDGTIPSIGFLRAGSRHQVVDVPHCPIASPPINETLTELRKTTFQSAASYKKGATLFLRESAAGKVFTSPGEVAEAEVDGIRLNFLAGDFFQNNPHILPAFTAHVASQASATGNRFLVDAYCGSGLFCLTAASGFETAAGVEISESSADWARHNARQNNIENTTFLAASAEQIFAGIDFPGASTSVIIDPPRKGCNQDFIDQLVAFSPSRIVYVSCNPATQMRDLALLTAAGYTLANVQPFDLFPQTKHLECVITLDRP